MSKMLFGTTGGYCDKKIHHLLVPFSTVYCVEDHYYLCETYPIFSPFSDLVIPSGQGQGPSEAPVALSSTCLEQKVFQLAETTYAGITKRKCIVSPCLGAGLCGQKSGLPLVGHSWFQWPCCRAQLSPAPTRQHLRENRFQHRHSRHRLRRLQAREKQQRDPRPKEEEGRRSSRPTAGNPLQPHGAHLEQIPTCSPRVGITGMISVKSLI